MNHFSVDVLAGRLTISIEEILPLPSYVQMGKQDPNVSKGNWKCDHSFVQRNTSSWNQLFQPTQLFGDWITLPQIIFALGPLELQENWVSFSRFFDVFGE